MNVLKIDDDDDEFYYFQGNWGASDTLIQEGGEKVRTNKEDDRLKKLKSKTEIDSYAECYPGFVQQFICYVFNNNNNNNLVW